MLYEKKKEVLLSIFSCLCHSLISISLLAIILDSTSMVASCIKLKVTNLLSLNNRENSASKALEKVILADVSVGLISSGILLYILLNLLVKSDTNSPYFLFKAPNSVI
jgi:hypothetical protein